MKNKSIILLSGGLDSLVSLGLAKEEYNIELAITFDYGQIAAKQEIIASEKICKYYGIKNEVTQLPFLKKITNTGLITGELPLNNIGTDESAKNVWVPNRNGLFINIAAAYADAQNYTHVIIGANKEEGETFPDNTQGFIEAINKSLKNSTISKVEVVAPLINYDKNDIVREALDKGIPLDLVYSCYSGSEKNCGKCESCVRLKNALVKNNAAEYIKRLF